MACALFNLFHPKFPTTMSEEVERACYERTVRCLNLRNCLLPQLSVQFPLKVLAKLTPQARWRDWDRVRLEDAPRYLTFLGFVPVMPANPAEELMVLSGGPSNITEAWSALTLLTERGLLADRLGGHTGSVGQYVAAASGLPKNALLHVLLFQGIIASFILSHRKPLLLLIHPYS